VVELMDDCLLEDMENVENGDGMGAEHLQNQSRLIP